MNSDFFHETQKLFDLLYEKRNEVLVGIDKVESALKAYSSLKNDVIFTEDKD